MKVIAFHTAVVSRGIEEVRQAMLANNPRGWHSMDFGGPDALLRQLSMVPNRIEELELIAEGSPVHLDGLDPGETTPESFGPRLAQIASIDAGSAIYLSGCNTGCCPPRSSIARCLAQLVANASGLSIHGSRGYIRGAHALGNEHTERYEAGLDRYDESAVADGADCWTTFRPIHSYALLMEQDWKTKPIIVPGFENSPITLSPAFQRQLLDEIFVALAKDSESGSALRVGPDLTFSIPTPDGRRRILEVIGNGAYLRDSDTRMCWRFEFGKKLLEEVALQVDPDGFR